MDAKALTTAAKITPAIPQYSCGLLPLHRKLQLPLSAHIRMRTFAVKATSSEESRKRSMVDEDMLELRKLMHQLRMQETNYNPPQHWMQWEKKWYPTYDSDVCSSIIWLQNILLNTRPSVVVAIMALISLSVAASILFLLIHVKGLTIELLTNLQG